MITLYSTDSTKNQTFFPCIISKPPRMKGPSSFLSTVTPGLADSMALFTRMLVSFYPKNLINLGHSLPHTLLHHAKWMIDGFYTLYKSEYGSPLNLDYFEHLVAGLFVKFSSRTIILKEK